MTFATVIGGRVAFYGPRPRRPVPPRGDIKNEYIVKQMRSWCWANRIQAVQHYITRLGLRIVILQPCVSMNLHQRCQHYIELTIVTIQYSGGIKLLQRYFHTAHRFCRETLRSVM